MINGGKQVKYGRLKGVQKNVSRIIYGAAMSPLDLQARGDALFDGAYARGINTFDLARSYVASEKYFGEWLEKRGLRDEVVIISKCAHPSMFGRRRVNRQDILNDFERSSRQLKTQYIDIYLLHRDDEIQDVSVAVEVMNELCAAGKIGVFGGSNWSHERIEQANEYAYRKGLLPFTLSSPNFSLAEQVQDPWGGGCVGIGGEGQKGARAWYVKQKMPVIAYSSLARGLFSGKVKSTDRGRVAELLDGAAVRGYCSDRNFECLKRCEEVAAAHGATVAQVALAWLFAQPLEVYAVVGAKSEQRLRENSAALELVLTAEEMCYLSMEGEQ